MFKKIVPFLTEFLLDIESDSPEKRKLWEELADYWLNWDKFTSNF